MKDIRLKSIAIDNFKGQAHLVLDFSGQGASIFGDNAAGKSTIYDALTWLLFGKDSRGQSNFEIKPLNQDGSVKDHAAITTVEAVFSAGLETISFKRSFYEKWSTKRGSATETFDGNTSDFYVDGVPCKKYEYESKVSDLVNEDVFRLLTGVTYFCADLDWKKRREILFDVCRVMTDAEIMEQDQRFDPLIKACGKLSVDDLKKKLQAERKGLSGVRNDVPVRLDECKKTVSELSEIDFSVLRYERDTRATEKDRLSAELLKLENDTLLAAKRNEQAGLKNQLDKLENENRAFRQSQVVQVHDPRPGFEREIASLKRSIVISKGQLDEVIQAIKRTQGEIENCRSLWKQVNGKTFQGQACPTCGQRLIGEKLQGAEAAFEKEKQDKLSSIISDSDIFKKREAQAKERQEALLKELAVLESQLSEANSNLAAYQPAEQPEAQDMPEYADRCRELESALSSIRAEIEKLEQTGLSVKAELRSKISDLSSEITAIEGSLAKEAVLQFTQERMEKLRDEARVAGEKIECLDSLLFLCDEFSRFKVQCIEDSINRRFSVAKFRLFVEQVNGGLADCCEVTCDGVPYSSLNNGAKINIGMDVIDTLSQHYGVSVPLFVDNAESVTRLYQASTQVIRLVVSEQDKQLRCEYGA